MTFVQVLQLIAFIPTIYAIGQVLQLMAFIPKIYAIRPNSTIDGFYTKNICHPFKFYN